MIECDKCGLNDIECQCYVHELEERISSLEESLDQLTYIVKSISDYIRNEKGE